MILNKIFFKLLIALLLVSCADYKTSKTIHKKEKTFYSSHGFALIYEDSLFDNGIINKKINNDTKSVIHAYLKKNTLVKIINPDNSKSIDTKIVKNSEYPKIFNLVISQRIAEILDLDPDNPYIEAYQIKKNKTFIAKKTEMFDEEKNVAEKAPVDEIKMDDLSEVETKKKTLKKIRKDKKFVLVISDFYYLESAENLKKELAKSSKINNFVIKKIANNKYRLFAGPFKNFNTLKSTYISLNNLGFDDLNIYTE